MTALPASPGVQVFWGIQPPFPFSTPVSWYESPSLDETGKPILTVTRSRQGHFFHFRYSEGVEFFLQGEPWQVWSTWTPPLTLADAATYFLGPILGFLLRLQGLICLHASAVAIGNSAIALLGTAGAGKSTTAAAFAQRGYPILADDVVVLTPQDHRLWIQPAYPRLRLWSESVDYLYGSPHQLPRIVPTHPTWDKQYLDLTQPQYHFQTQPLILTRIYQLAPRCPENHAPYLTTPSLQASLMNLVSNTYTNYLLDKTQRQQEFLALSALLQQIPVKKIIPHTDPQRIPQLLDLILRDLPSEMASTSSP